MAIDVKEYQRLKKAAADAKSEYDRAQGTLATLMETLSEDFSCKTVEEAEEKLSDFEKELKAAEAKFESDFVKYKKQFGELLDAR